MEMNTSAEAKMIEALGQAQPVSRQPKKETVMSFKNGPVYMGLKLVSPFNKDTQERIRYRRSSSWSTAST